MRSIFSLPKAEAQALSGVLFDLDDTLLDHTVLSEAAYGALFRLKESGLRLIALTGRPASWGELIVRMWPVDAAIAENGSVAYQALGQGPVLLDTVSSEMRQTRRQRLDALVDEVQRELPHLIPANDVRGRVSDYTFDIGESRQASEDTIARAIHLARLRGARTTRSSIHLHLTFDRMDKGSGALRLLTRLGYDSTSARRLFAFIGDSENDAAAFSTFETTVGVANLRGAFSLPPKYLTLLPQSGGFCQFTDHLCGLRSS